jgi:hypothetical protein
MVACRILLVVPGGCGLGGLSAASASDTSNAAAVLALHEQAALDGSVCVLQQLAPASADNACTDESSSGWCYVEGTCINDAGKACSSDLCLTNEYDTEAIAYQYVFLACP